MPGAKQATDNSFLQGIQIRTMKKDLKRLREFDSLKEREKISSIGTPKISPHSGIPFAGQAPVTASSNYREPIAKEPLAPPKPEPVRIPEQTFKANEVLEQIVKPPLPQFHPSPGKEMKEYAVEEEKQRIFQLEGEKLQLQERLKTGGVTDDSALVLEKNALLLEQKNWEKKLAPLAQGEGEKRWEIEREIEKLKNKIRSLEESYQKHNEKNSALEQETETINQALATIYSGIAERENIKKEELQEAFQEKARQLARATTQAQKPQTPQKGYLKDVPQAAREKLAQSTQAEQQKRRKFMEDVERWAKERNKQ